jgi:hypothetical protein
MCTNVCLLCSNWTWPVGTKPRLPGSMIGALLKKFWPGFYTTPSGDSRVAITWPDYEVAPVPGFRTAAEAVITKFWVRKISRVSFILDDPTVLTHDSHNFFLHERSAFTVSPMSIRSWRTRHCMRLV